mgnify:FL=1
MPVGVTVAADFETSGWTIAPKFDLSVVPTWGDKKADMKLGIAGANAQDSRSVEVIDSNRVQATLGLQRDERRLGLRPQLQARRGLGRSFEQLVQRSGPLRVLSSEVI